METTPGRAAEDDWRGRRVAVAGAGGHVGSHLVRALAGRGATVHALVREAGSVRLLGVEPIVRHMWDLADSAGAERLLGRLRPDVLFYAVKDREPHAIKDDDPRFAAAVDGGRRLMLSCARNRTSRVVVLGSSTEYGHHAVPLREDMAASPDTPHGKAKLALTQAVLHLAETEGLNAVVLRIFRVYGPLEASERFVPTVLRAGLDGGSVRLTPRGIVRDYVHVQDVVDACLRAGTRSLERGEIINVGSGRQTDNHDIVRMVQDLCAGAPTVASIDFPTRAVDTAHWCADATRARERLGWQPALDLRTGLAMTADFMRASDLHAGAQHA